MCGRTDDERRVFTITHPELGGGGGGGPGGGGSNLGVILVRICEPVFQDYPIHIPGLRKNGPIHILDHPKC